MEDRLQFFDLVAMKNETGGALASRLGYKKLFYLEKDLEIVDRLKEGAGRKGIVRSANNEVVTKMLRQNWVVGMLPSNDSVSKQTLEVIKGNEKVLVLPLADIVCSDDSIRQQKLNRMRILIRNVLRAKVDFVLVSLAVDKEGLLSSAQMVEVANFLGIEQRLAKQALNRLGELV